MAMLNTETAINAANGFNNLTIVRQLGLLIGLAASIAIGVGIAFWSVEPDYRPLYANISAAESSEIIDVLEKTDIAYKLNKQDGTILVDSDDVYQARLKLAAEGLPRGEANGFDAFATKSSFSNSQFMESARYKYALEKELERTISSFTIIKAARVHLAIPKRTSFVYDKQSASASVFLDIYGQQVLNSRTISAIVNLVASSVPDMKSENVTVVDEHGNLLNEPGNDAMSISDKFFNYQTQIENAYNKKIIDLLTPIMGVGNIKSEVSVELDFSQNEETIESYKPELNAIKAESTVERHRVSDSAASGILGAIASQSLLARGDSSVRNNAKKSLELNRTIPYVRNQPVKIKRVSVAVLLDHKESVDKSTLAVKTIAMTKQQLEQIKLLVIDAIGLNLKRGDSINVVNSQFDDIKSIESVPEQVFWQQAWFVQILKQVGGGTVILLIVFGVLLPTMKSLASKPNADKQINTQQPLLTTNENTNVQESQLSSGTSSYEQQIQVLKNLVSTDPKRVANVVKDWVDKG